MACGYTGGSRSVQWERVNTGAAEGEELHLSPKKMKERMNNPSEMHIYPIHHPQL